MRFAQLISCAASLALALPVCSGLQKHPITFDWVFDHGWELGDIPWAKWTSANRMVVLQNSGFGTQLVEINPKTKKRALLVSNLEFDRLATQQSLRKASLAAPLATDATVRRLAFLFAGRLTLFDLVHKRFSSIDAGDIKDVQFSPDGRLIAFAKARDLYVWDIGAAKERRLTTSTKPTQLNGVLSWLYWEEIMGRREIGYHWSPDSKRIEYLQTDESPVALSSFVDFRQLPPKVLTQRFPFAGHANPVVRVGLISAAGGPTKWIGPQSSTYEYVLRTGFAPNGSAWVLTMIRPQTKVDLWMSTAGGQVRHVLTDKNAQWINVSDDVYFLTARKHVIVSSQRNGYDQLYRYLTNGEFINQVTSGTHSVGRSMWVTQSLRYVDEKNGLVYFTRQDPDPLGRALFRVGINGTNLKRITKESGTHDVSFSPNGAYFLDEHDAINTPPSLTIRTAGGASVVTVQPSRTTQLANLDYSAAELIQIPARDGFKLPAYIRKPTDFDPTRKYPVVVHVYGGPGLPSVSDSWLGMEDQLFPMAGYVYVVVDNRSATTGNEKLPRSVKGAAVGKSELDDLIDAVHWLKGQPFVDPARVGLWGWSGGGNYTLLGMTRSKEFRAGVAVAPVTDWHFYDTFYTESLMGMPKQNPKGYYQTARWPDAKNLSGRLLMEYGTHDDNVHPINEEKFINSLIAAGKTCEVMIYPMRKHDLGDPAAYREVFHTMLEFFNRNL